MTHNGQQICSIVPKIGCTPKTLRVWVRQHERDTGVGPVCSEHGRKWSSITPEKFMQHVDTYIRWYNERRIKLSLDAVSPEMYRQQCGLA